VTLIDSDSAVTFDGDLTFTSSTAGSYLIVGDGGFQRGTFRGAAPPAKGSFSGLVFNDHNGNGVRDAADEPLAGRRVYLDKDADGRFDSNELSRISSASGAYQFSGVSAGT